MQELQAIINKLQEGKAPGADQINTTILKKISQYITPILVKIFNKTFELGIFPNILKKAIVVPIFKSGDRNNLNNYRPIALLSIFSKLLETCVKNRLENYLEKNMILSKRQFGYRKNLGTEEALLHFTTEVYKSLDKNNITIAIFLDIAKAFDTISQDILIQKLENIGIRGLPLNWFKTYLTNRLQRVKIANHFSDWQTVKSGVPQGSVLGAILFLIYINDLCDLQINGSLNSFVDDTAMLYSFCDPNLIEQHINHDLRKIALWFNNNKITLNVKKTKYITFTLKNYTSNEFLNFNFTYHSNCSIYNNENCNCLSIQREESIRYLGIVLDQNLNWKNQITTISNKLRYVLYKFYHVRTYISLDFLKIIYYALVQSHLQYGLLSWGGTYHSNLKQIETVQNKIIRTMTFSDSRQTATPIYKSLDILPLRNLYVYKSILQFKYKTLIATQNQP